MATQISSDVLPFLPTGVWHVDVAKSTLGFRARGMFGLVPVNGTFTDYEGTLTVDGTGAQGELRIAASSLDTGNAKRDEHLHGADFFDVEKAPTIIFSLSSVSGDARAGLKLDGALIIAENRLVLSAPVTATQIDADRLSLSTRVSVDRSAAGVGWSKLGMIQGKAHLHGILELVRAV
jgi:polyisoprenoid-binding protein YceI